MSTIPDAPAWPSSLWAAVTPQAPDYPSLVGTFEADVCIVGAGFTGLSTALHLLRLGRSVTVVEAAEPGWGASGRNNGQVIPTLSRPDPDEIINRHGEAGQRFVHLVRDSAQILFDLVREEKLAAEAEQTGWVQPVHSPGRMKIAERRVAQWAKHGAPVELLSSEAMAAKLGSGAWHGGWWNPTGGHINPLALTRAMAQAVVARGGTMHSHTPVETVTRIRGNWVVTMPRARIAAKALVVATNAYTGEFTKRLTPEIAREVVPVHSWQMATPPISDNLRRKILPERSAMSDTHGELYFMRFDARHRLITGGALINRSQGADRLRPYIGARLQRLFPDIGPIQFDYVWNGYVGMTRDFLPRFHQIGPDGYAWAGCNGRAVALSIAIGREFARALQGVPRQELALPFTEPAPLPFHGIVRRIAPLALLKYRWNDRREV